MSRFLHCTAFAVAAYARGTRRLGLEKMKMTIDAISRGC
jgi:hypothetical protein